MFKFYFFFFPLLRWEIHHRSSSILLRIWRHSNYFDFWSPFDPWKTIFSHTLWVNNLVGFPICKFLVLSPGKWKIHKRKISRELFLCPKGKNWSAKRSFRSQIELWSTKITVVAFPGMRFQRLLLRSKVQFCERKKLTSPREIFRPEAVENIFSGNQNLHLVFFGSNIFFHEIHFNPLSSILFYSIPKEKIYFFSA